MSKFRRTSLRLALAIVGIATLGFAAPTVGGAQVPTKPDSAGADREFPADMGPMFTQMISNQMQSTIDFFAREDVADKLARFTRNYYTALMTHGFTREEALIIVTSNRGLPQIPGR